MYRCKDGLYRYIYKITCLEGSWKGKYYYGKHTTDYLSDGYFSSGILINKYKKKYPHGYIKEIISFHNSEESLNQAEYDIIHPLLGNDMCLNLKDGGKGGGIKGLLPWNTGKKGCFSDDTIKKMRQSHINKPNPKLALYRKGKFVGEDNSRYGARFKWMNNGIVNKCVNYDEINNYLENGYTYGRKK